MIPRAAQSFDLSASFQSRRDDSSKFLDDYLTRGIYKKDPFQELDTEGVGSLMRIAFEARPQGEEATNDWHLR
jgi:hypothetical protein